MRCVNNQALTFDIGRAIAIIPEGAFDIGDDFDGGYGGDELSKLMEKRKADGDFSTG